MSLMLSRHGIWYYRKVNILPSGQRREFRRSLGTRSKCEALKRVERFHDRPWEQSDGGFNLKSCTQDELDYLTKKHIKQQVDSYIRYKSAHVCERECISIQRCIDLYLQFSSRPDQKSEAARFIDQLDLSIATKNKYVKKVSAFFRWLGHRMDIEIRNPFDGLMQKDNEAASSKREAYTSSQLKFLEGTLRELPVWKQWIILIGRYSGMRANEICQLYHDDIVKLDDVWCFKINDSKVGQTVKTANSRRNIPIHNVLLSSGLLAFVGQQNGHLFPQLKLYKGYYSHYFTKWFSGFRRKHNLPEFHSLRHYAASVFKNAGVPEQFAGALLGHSDQSITYNRYGKSVDVKQLTELVSLL
ncbi:site-specific integrase [Serratia fonticola]